MPTVIIADDDQSILTVLEHACVRKGYDVVRAEDGEELLARVSEIDADALITDVLMPFNDKMSSNFELMPRIKELRPELPIIIISAQNTLMTAVKANEAGAFEYLPKPFDLELLLKSLDKSVALKTPFVASNENQPVKDLAHPAIIGTSPAMQQIYKSLARMVNVDLTVMITGESGTGKEVVARAIHDLGARSHKPFVALNMAAIPKELVESELFGHEKGAFTGAVQRKVGKFELAEGGTIFLDEIGDMPLEAQTKLLRVLQQAEFTPVGSSRLIKTNVRIICATHRDLMEQVKNRAFREDLYYRLNVVPIRIPALRERKEDISILAKHFLRKARERGLPEKHLSSQAMTLMKSYEWPGNVRELENMVYRLSALVAEETIPSEAVAQEFAASPSSGGVSKAKSLEQQVREHLRTYFVAHDGGLPPPGLYDRILPLVERPLIEQVLLATNGNQIKAAQVLGINRNTLRKKIQELAITVKGSA